MKKVLIGISLMVLLIGAMATNAAALPQMSGGVSFAGNYALDTANISTATAFQDFSNVSVTSGSGTWAPVTGGTPAVFTPFSFTTPPSSFALWSFTFPTPSGTTYNFNPTDTTMTFQKTGGFLPTLTVQGMGEITASQGFDPTPGAFIITANQGGGTFSFSSSSVTVPEPFTLIFLGLGLVGVAAARKFKK
jgi:hypothetical protein